uniref:Uncharacterized protein n=1 Tax=Anguilla anguilla TaxID=7936 RepID=A0A0E9QBA2_ANGAN
MVPLVTDLAVCRAAIVRTTPASKIPELHEDWILLLSIRLGSQKLHESSSVGYTT